MVDAPKVVPLREQAAQSPLLEGQLSAPSLDGGGNGPDMPGMNERLAKLEGAFEGLRTAIEGLRHAQNMIIGTVLGVGGILAAFIIGFGVYSLQRMDNVQRDVSALPSQISAEMRDITKTLAESITAAKQMPPQVILIPAPQLPQPTPTAPKP